MVISFASRSASRMISSNALRRISPRSRGFLAAQPGNAALAASSAALASSTVALATDATLFSVAGSITSKRPPSEDLRHLPPIHRSVGTLARRLSYMMLILRSSGCSSVVAVTGHGALVPFDTGAGHVRNFKVAVLDGERLLQNRIGPVLPLQPMRRFGDA